MDINQALKIESNDSNTGKELEIKLKFKSLYEGDHIAFKVEDGDKELVEKVATESNIPYAITKKTTLDLMISSAGTIALGFFVFNIFLMIIDANKLLKLNLSNGQYKLICAGVSLVLCLYSWISASMKGAKNNNYVEVDMKQWKKQLSEHQ